MKYFFLFTLFFQITILEAQAKTLSEAGVSKISKSKTSKRKIASKKSLENISNNSTALIFVKGNESDNIGSGFFIAQSLLVTNKHVVQNKKLSDGIQMVSIETPDKKIDVGIVILKDPVHDIAIIKTLKTYKGLKLGSYSKVKMGDKISIISSPGGLIGTLSQGIVSAKRQKEGKDVLQFTAPISSGSSGSPVLDKNLNVIGISVSSRVEGQNLNFAIPVTYLKQLIEKNKKILISFNKKNIAKVIQGHSYTLMNLGLMYREGEGVKNLEKVFELAQKTARQGNAEDQYKLGALYYRYYRKKKAFGWIQKAAEQGHVEAQYQLGWIYLDGAGVDKDLKKAVYWFEKKADLGDVETQLLLGGMYSLGDRIAEDLEKSFYWYKKAAELGDAGAQEDVGLMYYHGRGVAKNYEKAFGWTQKAAEQGEAGAQSVLGMMYIKGYGVAKDFEKGVYWLEKKARQGDVEAQVGLGALYAVGADVVPKNLKKAIYWLEKAAKQGGAKVQYLLGDIYFKGEGVIPKNLKKAFYWHKKAFKWFEKAAEQGDVDAQYLLEMMYRDGKSVTIDLKKARYWNKKARKNRNTEVQDFLEELSDISK